MEGLDKTIIDLFHVLFDASVHEEKEFQTILNGMEKTKKQKLLLLFNERYQKQNTELQKLSVGLNLLVNNLKEFDDRSSSEDIFSNF